MPKHKDKAITEVAMRVKFLNNPNTTFTWYQRVKDAEAQIRIWKSYPYTTYSGKIKFLAILPADAARNKGDASTHLHEYDTWPNGSTCWLSREEIDYMKQQQATL
jgi:hypothetical protein